MVEKAESSGTVPSSSHRLPTISASDALRQLRTAGTRTISTGLPILDRILVGQALATYGHGGLVRGQLTEFFGPPGAGKTAVCLQAVASVLREGGHVTWIDCGFPICPSRLHKLPIERSDTSISNFHHYRAPELAHLLALFHHQPAGFPVTNTSLLVIDNVSAVFPLPSVRQANGGTTSANRSITAVFRTTLLAALTRIASTSNIAVVLTSGVITRFRQESRAMLTGALGGKDWEGSISSRIALFRDFAPRELRQGNILEEYDDHTLGRLRFAGVLKANGVVASDSDWFRDVIPFTLSGAGSILPITLPMPSSAPVLIKSPAPQRKRRLNEVPDSEDEWDAEVESLDGYAFDPDTAVDGIPATDDDIAVVELPELADRGKRVKIAEDNDNDDS